MKEKYYTPNKEDLYIGYEYQHARVRKEGIPYDCEIVFEEYVEYWKNMILEDLKVPDVAFMLHLDSRFIRTLYLTKEQIEREGWKEDRGYYVKNNIYLSYNEEDNNFITIDAGDPFTSDACDNDFIFKGECKSINEFRKICKFLKIE